MRQLLTLLFLVGFLIGGVSISTAQQIIKPNDKLHVVCEEEPSVNRDYVVTQDGLLLMSFIGAVKVVGLTEVEAANLISHELVRQRIVRTATVKVTLMTSDKLPVKFVGAVKTFGEVPWKEGLRLGDIVRLAQPSVNADLSRIQIESRTGQKVLANYALSRGATDNTNNPLLQPGDTITFLMLTTTPQVFVLGAVGKPGGIPFTEGMTVKEAIEKCGGFLENANTAAVQVESDNGAKTTVVASDFEKVSLKSRDRVVVQLIPSKESVSVVGGVVKPGSVSFTPGLTLTKAIQLAGGITPGNKVGDIKLVRKVDGRQTTRKINLPRVMDGFAADVELQIGDRIEIPQPGRRGRNDLATLAGAILFFFFLGGH